ncbi:hypothetical protein MSHO_60930 [Mycobacterium shottsii]|uniref:Uncharacterized protein n=1 Tax=Mycobacterium shottsii TaxID=133549 RepID=A0A7I7LLL7_9MYCO|nr:hypothetical protein MSHO_60930 [Mycobacterium shottsii]
MLNAQPNASRTVRNGFGTAARAAAPAESGLRDNSPTTAVAPSPVKPIRLA